VKWPGSSKKVLAVPMPVQRHLLQAVDRAKEHRKRHRVQDRRRVVGGAVLEEDVVVVHLVGGGGVGDDQVPARERPVVTGQQYF